MIADNFIIRLSWSWDLILLQFCIDLSSFCSGQGCSSTWDSGTTQRRGEEQPGAEMSRLSQGGPMEGPQIYRGNQSWGQWALERCLSVLMSRGQCVGTAPGQGHAGTGDTHRPMDALWIMNLAVQGQLQHLGLQLQPRLSGSAGKHAASPGSSLSL